MFDVFQRGDMDVKKLCLLLFCLCLIPFSALAFESTSYTFSYDALGTELRIVQDAYQPLGIYQNLGLKNAQDIAVANGKMYIADTGNRRVLVVDIASGETLQIKGQFSQPVGIAADDSGRIYVADFQKNAVFRFDAEGTLEMTYGRPNTPAYGVDNFFKPKSVAPIGDGGIYLIAEGTNNGIIQMNAEGEFVGFFASNAAYIPLKYKIYDIFMNDQQMSRFNLGTPGVYGDIMMGTDGLVYAINHRASAPLLKLSYTGVNLFAGKSGLASLKYPIDIAMAKDGTFFVLQQDAYIAQLSRDGVLLYLFGGTVLDVAREGLVQTAAGIGVDDDGNVYLLDKGTGQIHVYAPTSSQKLTQQAINSYYAGDYDEAGELLDKVLRYNSNSYYAQFYRGKTYMHMGNYQAAADQFYEAKERGEYSNAYWELRNIFLQKNGLWILLGVAGVIILWVVLRSLHPSHKEEYNSYAQSKQLRTQWHGLMPRYMSRAILHPIDTAYEIKHGHMGGYGVALVLIVLAVLAALARTLLSGFLFSQDMESFPVVLYGGGILVLIILFAICNYFITSINDGEGDLRMISSVCGYALAPLIIGFPLMTVICNALTLQEALVINTLTVFVLILCFVNLSVMLIELHNYSFRQYLLSIVLTVLLMILCILVVSLIYLLTKQAVDFFGQIWTEVAVRE